MKEKNIFLGLRSRLNLESLLHFILFLLLLTPKNFLLAAEVDSFRGRYENSPDMLNLLNKKTTFYFKEVIKELNKKTHKCETGPFYKKK